MKENIKEDIKTVEYNMKCIRNVMNNFEDELCENMQTKTDEVSKIIDNILSDYKRVLKENEELLQEKINNQKIIVLAQNDMLNYQAGFEEGKNGRTSAVQSIIENQQYYIFQKQIEKYEEHIEKLQKKNEELKNKYATFVKMSNEVIANSIPKQKVKDKIEKEKLPLVIIGGRKNKKTLEYGIKLGRRQALRELIEERED